MDIKKQVISALKLRRTEILTALSVFKNIDQHDLSSQDKSYLNKLEEANRKIGTKLFLLS